MKALINILEKLHTLHEHLFDLAKKKTEVLKSGDVDSLQLILREEQKCTSAITVAENEREKAARIFLQEDTDADVTLSACIQAAGNDERASLQALQENMSQVIGELHAQNELNKQLIQQTLQYVHLTLDLLQPQPESAIYERPAGKKQSKMAQSFFDSKA
ncbi:flagellar protein FlgN [Siminovitchia sp. FSL H7-0308]|uniref:Flagellar biosynthesis/type III secretory pathway chaperone n=1 Tax=Siminovitchia thermophila TaxID=1245522 RepID=A0ABS2R3G1_9BACI|nr:flagellar protein FlgN [Siminovitchia thermophila]MBM7714187.1 flagellar biosynthesis/type III secretory pathway chaperone [Siminovitchia thermophila]ONK23397.1 hypothetical protein BLX87_11050 [Bacillus sp. VT-16-64]